MWNMERIHDLFQNSEEILSTAIIILCILCCGALWLKDIIAGKDAEIKKLKDEKRVVQLQLENGRKYWTTQRSNALQREESKDLKILELQTKVKTLNRQVLDLGGNDMVLLDELIAQRKEAKQKALKVNRARNIISIRARRAQQKIFETFPEDAFERLLTIWPDVFEYLKDQSDLSSTSSACQAFSDILDGRRKHLLLPKVLSVFKMMVEQAYRPCQQHSSELEMSWARDWKMICFSARGVCKAWKEVAEFQLFDSNFTKDDWFLTTHWRNERNPASTVCELSTKESVDEALSIILSSKETILIRDFRVSVDRESANSLYYTKVAEFLKLHGTAVWFFTFYCYNTYATVEVWDWFLTIMECMPNLKGLELVGTGFLRFGEENFRRSDERKFPALDSLEHLEYDYAGDDFLFLQILRKCVNLKSVVGRGVRCHFPRDVARALMELRLVRYEGAMSSIITSNWIKWPLKRLEIYFSSESVNCEVLFNGINRFQETLEHFSYIDDDEMYEAYARLLKFPNLKTLEIRLAGSGLVEMDDLLQFECLEKITLYYMIEEDEMSKVKVLSLFNGKGIEETNIFDCFPNLKRLEIPKKVFQVPPNCSLYDRIAYLK